MAGIFRAGVFRTGIFRAINGRLSSLLWTLLTRREFRRTRRLRATHEKIRLRLTAGIADLDSRLRRQEREAKEETERLKGEIAILNSQLQLYADIVERERRRVEAETAVFVRRSSEAKWGAGVSGPATIGVLGGE